MAGSDHRHWSMRPEARQRVLRAMVDRPGFRPLLDSIDVSPDDMFATYLRDGLQGADLNALIPAGRGSARAGCSRRPRLPAQGRSLPRGPTRCSDRDRADLDRRVRRQIAADGRRQVPCRRWRRRDSSVASGTTTALLEYSRTVLATDRDWVPSFVLVGPGGVGKSALVSTFVLDQRRQAAAAPLIYLDFDRATLIDATPLDLTHEFARQLGLARARPRPVADRVPRTIAVAARRAGEPQHRHRRRRVVRRAARPGGRSCRGGRDGWSR